MARPVVLGVDGIAHFNALYSRKHDEEVQLYAFDIVALDGEDLRKLPLSMRKTNLARLLARPRTASSSRPMRLERSGLTYSARRASLDSRAWCQSAPIGHTGGRSPDWVKVKNRKHPALNRVM
jgi:bifunctional non-homologous end joining protein LigD